MPDAHSLDNLSRLNCRAARRSRGELLARRSRLPAVRMRLRQMGERYGRRGPYGHSSDVPCPKGR